MTLDSGNVRFMRIFAVVLEIYVNFSYTYTYACALYPGIVAVAYTVLLSKSRCVCFIDGS